VRDRTVYLILSFIQPVERFLSNVMKFRSFGDGKSSKVQDKLKTVDL